MLFPVQSKALAKTIIGQDVRLYQVHYFALPERMPLALAIDLDIDQGVEFGTGSSFA